MKAKNAPGGLKCKINHFFFGSTVPKRGGSDIWEKFPNKSRFLFWVLPLTNPVTALLIRYHYDHHDRDDDGGDGYLKPYDDQDISENEKCSTNPAASRDT